MKFHQLYIVIFLSFIVSCANDNIYRVRVIVSGLEDSGTIVLQNNGEDDLKVSGNGPFDFSHKLASGDEYNVTILTQPSGQSCVVANGTGTIASSSVANITVTCGPGFTVGGTVTGQTGQLTLQNNGTDDLVVAATDTTFTFATTVGKSGTYDVTVSKEPSGQTCAVTNGSGTIDASDIANVTVTCTTTVTKKLRIFITASTFMGNEINGVAGADTLCANDAAKPATGTYKALIADGTTRIACVNANCSPTAAGDHTGWVLKASTKYYRPNQTTVIGTTNANRVFTFPVGAGISGTQSLYWTGLLPTWIKSNACGNWTNNTGMGYQGDSDEVTSSLISSGATVSCATASPLACVEQ